MSLRLSSAIDHLRGVRTPLDRACERLVQHNAWTLDAQASVTRIAAPTGEEGTRAAWMAGQLAALGWSDVVIDDAGNVIARHPDLARAGVAEPAVWCCAHLDTVFDDPAPQVTRSDSRLAGPGIGDNGRGLAALLALADAIHHAGVRPPHEIILACTVGEEGLGDLRGMKHLMREAVPRPRAVIAIDGAGDDRIVNAALGSLRWRITFTGAGGHSWADFGIANPVHAVASVAAALHGVLLPREPRTTLTVSRIGGGESINSIPREAWLEVDLRSLETGVLDGLARTLRETVQRIERSENGRRAQGTPPLTSRIDLLGERPCGVTPESSPLVRLAQQATRSIGAVPRVTIGSTDASVPIALGIAAIAIGAGGRGGGTHTPDEWYDDTNGVRGLQRALRIVVGAASQPM